MSTSTRIPSSQATEVARRFLTHIEPWCERIVVAGSLRRRATLVGDVEIVCVPKVETIRDTSADLFGEVVTERSVDLLDAAMTMLLDRGVVSKRAMSDGSFRFGPLTKYLTFEGVPVDLFATPADRFGWTLAIRTGPAEFSRQLVVERGHKTKDRRPGLLPSHLRVDKGLVSRMSGERFATPDEESVFTALNLPYRAPEVRR